MEPHLRSFPYRCVAPTFFGYDAAPRRRFRLKMRDHFVLIDGLLRAVVEDARPRLVLAAGFSVSGDFLLRFASSIRPQDAVPLDGILAAGCNLGIETCFLTGVLARLDAADPARLMGALRSMNELPSSLEEWLVLHSYVTRILLKFRHDVTPLRELSREFVGPFEEDSGAAFAEMFRGASARVRSVRCLFEDTETCNRLLRAIHLRNREDGFLGPLYRDGCLLVEDTPSHFELIQPSRFARHLSAMVEELSAPR